MERKTRITIIAESRDGQKEQVRLTLPKKVAERLYKAANTPDCYGENNDLQLTAELNYLYEDYQMRHLHAKTELTWCQYYKLRDFYNACYNRFQYYTLTII